MAIRAAEDCASALSSQFTSAIKTFTGARYPPQPTRRAAHMDVPAAPGLERRR
jgi:hypothetical protein